MKVNKTLLGLGVLAAGMLVVCLVMFDIVYVPGNELGVLETWGDGVQEEPLQPRTYFYFPGFWYTAYTYDMSSQVYVMNDIPSTTEYAQGREEDSYLVQSEEGQDMHISMNVRWRLDPEKIVEVHKTIRDHFEEKILRPVLMRVVKDEGTQMEAVAAYSGKGLVTLQTNIFDRLTALDGEMAGRGIIVENFVIEGISLDKDYIGEIRERQVAQQKELKEQAEEKAAMAAANRARAEARSDYEKTVVEAERDKQVGVLKAEEEKEVMVLAAEADKEKQVLAAEGEKEASVLRAEAILAIGTSEAEAKRLALSAYAVEGADAFVKIEVAKSMAEGFKNIQGYLPESMKINVLSGSYADGVNSIVGKRAVTAPVIDAINDN